jgi:O-antigen biosynthesis protein WbqP
LKNLIKYDFWKRIIDILLAVPGFIILCIPILLIGLIIKTTSKGPVIYWSKRVGRNNKSFRMAKLRTMKVETPEIPSYKINNDEKQLIRFGKFLRKTGIDELPQLYNILKGDMSIVGPRPVISDETELITLRTKKEIHKIKPGITGLAQVKGREKLNIQDKIKYDEIYLQSMSFILDIKILFLTNCSLLSENVLK